MLKRVPRLPVRFTKQGEPISTSSCASATACDIQEPSRLLTEQNPLGLVSLSLPSAAFSGALNLTRMPGRAAFSLFTFTVSQTNMAVMTRVLLHPERRDGLWPD